MKRINPETNLPFRRGDIREDGKIFSEYKKKLNSNGYFKENWYNPEYFELCNARYSKNNKRYGKTKAGSISSMLRSARTRAKNKNLPINIDLKYLTNIITDVCPIFGTPFKWDNPKMLPDSPTLDRITPELGYIKGNVQIISSLANTMKSNATPTELLKFAEWIVKNYGVK